MMREHANLSTKRYFDIYADDSGTYAGPNQSLIKSTTAMVNIFYDSMSYVMFQESPQISFDTLLSNIGGNLGLFTGASILTSIELIELLLAVLILHFKAKRKISRKPC